MSSVLSSNSTANLLNLRNRLAHHEPIYHLPLVDLRNDLSRLLTAMCPAAVRYASTACTLNQVLELRPAMP